MQLKIIRNLDEMEIFVNFFIKNLPRGLNKALVVGLSGELGSGKTAFVQSISRVLGINKYITSPTFVIQKKYKIMNPEIDFQNLIHIDAYRLSSGDELLNLGWEEIVKSPKNIIFVEWPEKIKSILNNNIKYLYFKFIDEQTREIFYEE